MSSSPEYTVETIIDTFLKPFAPLELAESWDNVGLLVGRRTRPVHKIMTCLTVNQSSADEAVEEQVDLIVSHHPIPFHALKRITDETATGRILLTLMEANVAVYAPHSAFDSAARGINARIAAGLGLTEIRPIQILDDQTGLGIGRLGTLKSPQTLEALAHSVKRFFRCDNIDVVGPASQKIQTVAVTCGAAGSLFDLVKKAGVDALILGETNFHTYLDALDACIGLVLPGHYATERFACQELASEIAAAFPEIEVFCSRKEAQPQWKLA